MGMEEIPMTQQQWLREVQNVVYNYLLNHETMFVDDIWPLIPKAPKKSGGRGLGGVFGALARKGFMVHSGECKRSTPHPKLSPKTGCAPYKPVWKSLICKTK